MLRDNAGAARDSSTRAFDRSFMYAGYVICMVLAFVWPRGSLYVIGVIAVALTVRIFTAKEQEKMIFYFSGTGNTKFIAEYLAETLGDKLTAMADVIRRGETLRASSDKPYIFLAPIYAWRFPRAVEDLIRSAELGGSKAAIDIKGRTEGQPRYTCPEYQAFLRMTET